MSDLFYPLGLIEKLDVVAVDRTLADEFEDGGTTTRALWGEKYFKRKFALQHSALTPAEFAVLRDFFAGLSGRYDSFWFRDNVHRTGNAKVRLAEPFALKRSGMVYRPELTMEEIAPVRAIPGGGEIQKALWDGEATQYLPMLVYDADRQLYYLDNATPVCETGVHESSGNERHLTWTGVPATPNITLATAQHQCFYMLPAGSNYAVGAAATAWPSTGKYLLFAGVLQSLVSGVCFAIGSVGSGTALGMQYKSSGSIFTPYLGSTGETYTNAKAAHDTHSTKMTVGIVFDLAGGTVSVYKNGVLAGTDSVTYGTLGSGISLLCEPDGTSGPPYFEGNPFVLTSFKSSLSNADAVKALHNMYAYQLGLATI